MFNKYILLAILIVLTSLSGCLGKSENAAPSFPIKIELSLDRGPALGQTATLTYTVEAAVDMSNMIEVFLSEGFGLVSGTTTWVGNLKKNEPITSTLEIKALKTGQWVIGVGTKKGGGNVIYVLVSEKEGKWAENGFITPAPARAVPGVITAPPGGYPPPPPQNPNIPPLQPAKREDIKLNPTPELPKKPEDAGLSPTPPAPPAQDFTAPLTIYLSLNKGPALGEIATLTFTLESLWDDFHDLIVEVNLPEGIALAGGTTTWQGNLNKKEPVQSSLQIKALKTGEWEINAFARTKIPVPGLTHVGRPGVIFILVSESEGKFSRNTFRTPGPAPRAVPLPPGFTPYPTPTNTNVIPGKPGIMPPGWKPPSPAPPASPVPTPLAPPAQDFTAPLTIDLSLNKGPALGEVATLTFTLQSIWNDFHDLIVEVVLPEGIGLLNGTTTWQGNLNKKEPVQSSLQIKALKTGNWEINAFARTKIPIPGLTHVGRPGVIFILVSESEGKFSRNTFFKREYSPFAQKVDPSSINFPAAKKNAISEKPGDIKNLKILPIKFNKNTSTNTPLTPLTFGNITIKGHFYYPNRQNQTVPAFGVTVYAWDYDEDTGNVHSLGETITDVNGYYEIPNIHNEDPEGDGTTLDVYLVFVAANDQKQVNRADDTAVHY